MKQICRNSVYSKKGNSYRITKRSTGNLENEKYGDVKINIEVDTKVF